jgi:glycosyltransferase involved in cell wall biosynthesis
MTVHFFTKGGDWLPDSHLRAYGIAKELEACGVKTVMHFPPVLTLSLTPWPKKLPLIIETILSLRTIKKGDIVFLQRAISNKYFFLIMVTYLALFRRPMVFDFDDAIYTHNFYKTKIYTQMASAVFVGGRALETWAKQYSANVHIFHTSLKFKLYEPYTKDYSVSLSPLVIGWVGTARNHHENLAMLASVLRRLVKEATVPFKFILVGVWGYPSIKALFEDIPGLMVEFVEYLKPEELPRMVQSFDIGVMPLAIDNEWNRARSSFKPIEYMACGLATISAGIGAITDVVKDGENGYLAVSEDEWVEKLKKLLGDTELRARLGREGQRVVREHYCHEAIVPRMIKVFEEIAR